jgi:hypothetical protein
MPLPNEDELGKSAQHGLEKKVTAAPILLLLVSSLLFITSASADPIDRSAIEIVDGDTIHVDGKSVRLVGFDTPETGDDTARCDAERERGKKATARLADLLGSGTIEIRDRKHLERYGRRLALLTVDGRNVAQKNFSLTQQETVSIFRSTLDDKSVDAYIACLKKGGVSILIPPAAVGEDGFLFSVEWRPDYRTNNKEYDLNLLVKNGSIDGSPKRKVRPTDTTPFSLTRDPTKKLFIVASIDGKVDEIALPRRPGFVMKLRERTTERWSVTRDGGHGTDYVEQTNCVTANQDSILLPSTWSFVGTKVGDQSRIVTRPAETGNGPNRFCGVTGASTGANQITIRVDGHFSVFEAYLEDSNDGVIDKTGAVSTFS